MINFEPKLLEHAKKKQQYTYGHRTRKRLYFVAERGY